MLCDKNFIFCPNGVEISLKMKNYNSHLMGTTCMHGFDSINLAVSLIEAKLLVICLKI